MEQSIEEPQPKRRKVRKGTRTCWECKRRKVRCIFESPDNPVCVGCARRCLRCVSQEFPEETTTSAAKSRLVGDRIVRVEAMIQQLVQQSGGGKSVAPAQIQHADATDLPPPAHAQPTGGSSPAPVMLTPEATNASASVPHSVSSRCASIADDTGDSCVTRPDTTSTFSRDQSRPEPGAHFQHRPLTIPHLELGDEPLVLPARAAKGRLSEALLAAYPPQRDLDLIASCTNLAYNYYQVIVRSHRQIHEEGFFSPAELRIRYTPQTHPVLIARQMLIIAIVLQITDFSEHNGLDQLSEPSNVIMERLGDTAISLVTTNDALLDTLDGLECLILEAVYRGNIGYLRRSWLTWRRAFSMAQLMCIPRQNRQQQQQQAATTTMTSMRPGSHLDPQYLWYRIVTAERFTSLLLGLPQASPEAGFAAPDVLGNDTPMAQLEYRLVGITSDILDRNRRGPHSDDYAATKKIDLAMQEIALSLPTRWWLAPNLAAVAPEDDNSIWETLKLSNQIFYYHLLHQLHLPYMMGPSSESEVDQRRSEYSRIACISSSREILSRYIVFRNFNKVACCYRVLEFFAMMASLTLILVHLDGHRNGRHANSFLAHQRLSDRAMTEQALESMDLVRKLNDDAISETSVDLLRQLLAIERDTARGSASNDGGGGDGDGGSHSHTALESCCDEVRNAGKLQISVPYVGLISIGTDGKVTKEAVHEQQRPPGAEAVAPGAPQHLSRRGLMPPGSTGGMARGPSTTSQTLPPAATNAGLQHAFQAEDMLAAAPATATATATAAATLTTETGLTADMPRFEAAATSAQLGPGPQLQQTAAAVPPRTAPNLAGPMNNNSLLPQDLYPRPAAGMDQWAFQGVDMAFFDNLIRETNNLGPGNNWIVEL